jgi:hypothetical protein
MIEDHRHAPAESSGVGIDREVAGFSGQKAPSEARVEHREGLNAGAGQQHSDLENAALLAGAIHGNPFILSLAVGGLSFVIGMAFASRMAPAPLTIGALGLSVLAPCWILARAFIKRRHTRNPN